MKVSCIPVGFFQEMLFDKTMPLEDWIEMASDLKLDGIEVYELYLERKDEEEIARYSDLIHKAGLEVSMFTSYADFSSPDSAVRAEQVTHVRQVVDMAVAFETNIVRMTAGSWIEGISRDDILTNIANGFKECLDYAESQSVMLALEDHPEVGTKIEDFMRILELVDDDRLKVNLDTSNPMVSGDSSVDLAELVKDKIVHLHASDRYEDLGHTVVGEGAVDFPGVFKVLKSADYDGWISLEAGGSKGKEGIRQGMEYVKNVWNNV